MNKTIFDKIDSKYLECVNGICEHMEHKVNAVWWILAVVAIVSIGVKYFHDTRRN